jgi:hypothetical protein
MAQLIAEALAAAQRIRALGRADASLLEPIVAAVVQETARNRFPAAKLMADLTSEYAEARAAVKSLIVDARSHVRRRALRCLGGSSPPEFAAEILSAGLADADASVRMKAVSVAGLLGLSDMVERHALPKRDAT